MNQSRIDVFCANPTAFSRENYCSRELERGFDKLEIPYKHISLSEGGFSDYLLEFHSAPPAWTLSFEDLFSERGGICQALGRPHLIWTESLPKALGYLQQKLGWVGYGDEEVCESLQGLGYSNIIHLPDGISDDLDHPPEAERPFDVVIFDSLVDIDDLEKTWEGLFDPMTLHKLHEIVYRCEDRLELVKAVLSEKGLPIGQRDLLFFAWEYLQAKKIVPLVESLGSIRVDLFGEHMGNNWLRRLKNGPSIHLHWSLVHTESLEVLKQAKILIADKSSPWYLSACAAGCLVCDVDGVERYLRSPAQRIEWVREEQREIVQKESWEKRALRLMDKICVSTS